MFLNIVIVLFSVNYCAGIIHDLDDSTYDLMPRLFALDEYDGCLKHKYGLYCTMQIDLHEGPNKELHQIIQEYSEFQAQHFNHSLIDRGVCVTKKCQKYVKNKTADLEWILGACLNDSIYSEYGLKAKVSRFYCDRRNEETVIDASDWIVAACIGFVVLINVVGSLYHYCMERKVKDDDSLQKGTQNKGKSFLLCFSVFNSWKWLVYKSEHPQLASLQGLHGMRSLAMFLMVFAHVAVLYGKYVANEHYVETVIPSYWIVANGAMITQMFFVMTGILLALKMQMAEEKVQVTWSMVPKIIFFRWLRLTPAYVIMIAFSATWMRHIGSGPLWKMVVTETVSADCRQYWWHHILYFNNYVGDVGKNCAAQSWYVQADMQLFIVGVIVLVSTQARGRTLALVLLTVVGVIAPALHVWKDGLAGSMLFTPGFVRSLEHDTFHHLHIQGQNNLSAFAVGMSAAVLIYRWQKAGKDFTEYKKYLGYTIHVCFCLCVLVMYIGCELFLYQDGQQLWVRMAYQSLHRLFFSVLTAIGFVALAFKTDDSIRKVLEWDGWVVPSHLCYSVYIVHMIFVTFLQGTKLYLSHMTFFNWLYYHMIVVCLSFMAALPFCLAVEAPMIALVNTFKGRPDNTKNIKAQ